MIIKIKEALYNQEEKIRYILEDIGCHNIHKTNKDDFRFGFDDEGTGSGNSLSIRTLGYMSFSRNKKGDILTLVADVKKIKLGESIEWLAKKLNIKKDYNTTKQSIKLPFGGFFKEYNKVKDIEDSLPKTYNKSVLNQYIKYGVSKMFIDDGISALTQEKYNIGYDIISDRITIPWLDETGELIGIMGRLNKLEFDSKYNNKYLPIIPFNKSKALYGLYENYEDILDSGYIIIAESEKSSMKGRDLGFNNVVSLGGNNISPRQAKLIKSTFCKVIIALDEGISIEHCIEQAKKVQIDNVFFTNEVYFVDMNNPYIENNKVSLLDLDLETINKVLKEYLIYVD